jgi:hypothetical protein
MRGPDVVPARIGPAESSSLGSMIAVRCPSDLDPWMRKEGGLWEPGSRRWLIERRRIGPLIRNLRRNTDPLFRQAGISLDEGPEGARQPVSELAPDPTADVC